MKLIDKLDKYYKETGIHANSFCCSFKNCCSKRAIGKGQTFTEATSSYIPEKYEDNDIKLAFLSLDPGNGQCKEKRTPQGVRKMNQEMTVSNKNKNKHWYKTHFLATKILNKFKKTNEPDISIEESKYFFVNINCSKCSENNKGNAQATQYMLNTCAKTYLKKELAIIMPTILITQGVKARDITKKLFWNKQDKIKKINKIIINNTEITWIWLYHPTSRNNPKTKITYYKEDLDKLSGLLDGI